jgi:hypothetical protein
MTYRMLDLTAPDHDELLRLSAAWSSNHDGGHSAFAAEPCRTLSMKYGKKSTYLR